MVDGEYHVHCSSVLPEPTLSFRDNTDLVILFRRMQARSLPAMLRRKKKWACVRLTGHLLWKNLILKLWFLQNLNNFTSSMSESPPFHAGGMIDGLSGDLHSGGDAHSVWLRLSTVVSKRHNRWRPAYVESEQASLNITEVAWQQCGVSFWWHLNDSQMSSPVDI